MSQARKALLDLVSGKPVDATPPKAVPRQFVTDFELVATRYNLRELGEYEQAKEAARRDIENAEICFSAMAKENA